MSCQFDFYLFAFLFKLFLAKVKIGSNGQKIAHYKKYWWYLLETERTVHEKPSGKGNFSAGRKYKGK